ncbi:MAG: hypothetical protein ACE15C_18575 [Phycisphaerae bacterium]
MSPVKEQAIRIIESLPESCTLEDIQYHLYVCGKVERGIAAIGNGDLVQPEEVVKKVRQWARSSGPSRP